MKWWATFIGIVYLVIWLWALDLAITTGKKIHENIQNLLDRDSQSRVL